MTGGSRLHAARRTRDLEFLAGGGEVDVLVVGGGVTGAGVALDAASRGLSVALLERRDLANGTSRWSSKLAHGGLRYLTRGQVGVAWESARERAILMDRTAPHLVRALPMLVPLTRDVAPGAGALMETGIRVGDRMRALAGTSRRRLPPTRRVTAEEARRWAPGLAPDGLRGAILHWDGQLEDDARLVVAIARTAAAHGARIVTYCTSLDGGARARDELSGAGFEVRARHVIMATGVWTAGVTPSRGSHLLFGAERLGDPRAAVSVQVPGTIGRFVFALPRPDGLVLAGLTDEPYEGDGIPDAPDVTAGEERFLLETLSRALGRPLAAEDVVGRFAGLRPLLPGHGATADLSRRHSVTRDGDTVTVVGGKLTTYRRMAQDAVDAISDVPCRTHHLPLVGAGVTPGGVPTRLVRRYGAEATQVAMLGTDPVAPGIPALTGELRFAVEAEGALTVEDVLDRRLRLGLVPAWRTTALGSGLAVPHQNPVFR
jgi:glycerol-3-phosphate dehydrogenase